MTNPLPPLAFGFGSLAMLGWLAAAAAPLLIHLWSRHRFRETQWAAVQFLLAAMRKNARRMQLQQWMLLALRTLLIVMVVLAVAEPYGEGLIAGGSTSAPAHKILVIDGSFSMAYQEGDATHFARAKQLAAELVGDSSSADAFTVILMAGPARTILSRDVIDRTAIASQIEALSQSHAGADLTSTLALVAEALDHNASDSRGLSRQEVYFFTDLQRTTWQTDSPAGSHAPRGNPRPGRSRGDEALPQIPSTQSVGEVRSHAERGNESQETHNKWAALAQQAALVVVDVGTPRAANLAVTQLAAAEPFVTVGREAAFTATLRQFGDEPQNECAIELLVDDRPVSEQTIDVPAGGEATVRFTHRFNSAGSHAVALRAAGDKLVIDNSRFLVAPVKQQVRVLCVAGRDGAAKFIAQALHPDASADSAIEPVIVSEGDLADVELADFDCIFLCNVAQLTANEAERLTRYTQSGGGIVFFLGDRVIAEPYNQLAQNSPAILAGDGQSTSQSDDSRAEELPQNGAAIFSAEESRPRPASNPQSTIRNPQSATSLFPARITGIATLTTFGIDPLDYRHPIVAPFRGRERAGLLTTPIARYHKLDLSQISGEVEVAAAVSGGDPLIVTSPFGRGRTVIVATDGSLTSVDPSTGEPWTTWPTWPSFLPIVREVLAYAAGGRHDQWQYFVGAPLGGTIAASADPSGANLQIVRPDGRTDPLTLRSTPGGWQWTYEKTDVSGIYALRGASPDASDEFAVNVDTAESDLAKADADSLPSELLIRDTWQNSEGAATADLLPRAGWDRSLLWIALAIMFFESLLAWQFGRGAA